MSQLPRRAPLKQFPVTQILYKTLPKVGLVAKKPVIVSEKLCDDVTQRLSPYLLRNPPVDILDLWPGPGILSSKVNDLLKPRRHVLIEPNLKTFGALLKPLAQSRPCYKLVSTELKPDVDWLDILSRYFPEQGPSNTDNSGVLPRNDTLLVMAHPPPPLSSKDHMSGSRWFLNFVETCLWQTDLHRYGSVRLLASISPIDSRSILPSLIHERERPAVLSEHLAGHAFAVAASHDPTRLRDWAAQKHFDVFAGSAARVAQRTSEAGFITPAERQQPPLELAPEAPLVGNKPTPYVTRARSNQHDKYLAAFKAFDKADPESPGYDKIKKARSRASVQLSQENRQAHARNLLTDRQVQIYGLNKSISRLAADPEAKLADLDPIVKEVEALTTTLAEEMAQHHFDTTRAVPYLIDDRRAAFDTGSYDDAVLLWDRRPFEPLVIHEDEMYPRGLNRTLLYFEADPNAHSAKRLSRLTQDQQYAAYEAFEAFSFCLSGSHLLTVEKLMEILFPAFTANEIVKAFPSLARFASKRPKPNFDDLPKTLHYEPDFKPPALPSTTEGKEATYKPDPAYCYQENLDYDLSGVRCRVLPTSTLWDIFAKYSEHAKDHSIVQLSRSFGGNVTNARSGIYQGNFKTRRI
ncbi:hypothetical protein BJX64DRAFT_258138 [Aspergillus heterothallicus]